MSITNLIAAIGTFFAGIGTLVALITLIIAALRYQRDQLRQRADQTREDLQAIIGDCNLFLHPLNQRYPYPILHTAVAITEEFCSRMVASPQREDVQALFKNKELLLSICVEGWISSSQILHMMDIVEKVEYKASSRNLQGKLVLIREASFLLAGLVAEICSPESFYEILSLLEPDSSKNDTVQDILNTTTIELQQGICNIFSQEYKDKIERSLYFIQTAANIFIGLTDEQLRRLAKRPKVHKSHSTAPNLSKNSKDAVAKIKKESSLLSQHDKVQQFLDVLAQDTSDSTAPTLSKNSEDPIAEIKKENSLLSHYNKVQWFLGVLEGDIGRNTNYQKLCGLIEPLEAVCQQYEKNLTNASREATTVNIR